MKEKNEESTIYQFGVTNDGRMYRAVQNFYLETTLGPPTIVKKGSRVLLNPRMATELFHSSKIEPLELGETFEVIRHFRTAQKGEWIDLVPGDIVKLSREECLPLLRANLIKERKEVSNEG